MNIVIDLTSIYEFFSLPPDQQILIFLLRIGWIPVAIMFLYGFVIAWKYWRQVAWSKTIKFTLLAIDIPKGNDQSLRAVENLFTYLGGAHDPPDLIEEYWIGKFQISFSFEIISIEGYIQFLIRTPIQYRDLIETAIYSQYPDAEITEVDDYVDPVPVKYPDDEYDIWGGEMILNRSDVYPILTYKYFEHQFGEPEKLFRDPMASLMDLLSSMKKGEQFWYQIIVYPHDVNALEEKGRKEISKILKEKATVKRGMLGDILGEVAGIFSGVISELTGQQFGGALEEKKEDALRMMNLKPKEKKQVESIQQKVSKLGFKAKIRYLYVAKREVMNKPKAVAGFIGYMKQFIDVDLNNLKPDLKITGTTAHYLFIEYRKNEKKIKLIKAYKTRSGTKGREKFILDTEELATLWHVPIEAVVRAPLVQKAPGRKAEPPMSLPLTEEGGAGEYFEKGAEGREDIFAEADNEIRTKPSNQPPNNSEAKSQAIDDFNIERTPASLSVEKRKGTPPENLPFV
ncbi:MAG: hypothetical protein NTW06_02015 [Candidatus Falkowbacteria bacterium]|nr:hypothetical protein [Candidatus Falkowbacteria bacterium]